MSVWKIEELSFQLLLTVQEQLTESLARLMWEFEGQNTVADSVRERLNGIESTVARFDECVKEQRRTIDECKQKCDPPVCAWIDLIPYGNIHKSFHLFANYRQK